MCKDLKNKASDHHDNFNCLPLKSIVNGDCATSVWNKCYLVFFIKITLSDKTSNIATKMALPDLHSAA